MAAGGLVSSMCLLMVTTLGQSRLPMVLAEDGLFPRIFARRHPRFETPTVSLVVGGVVLSLLVLVRFSYLAGLFSIVQVLAYLLIFGSLLRLRSHAPVAESPSDAAPEEAPFRIPLGTAGLALMMVPSLILSGMVIVESIWPDGAFDKWQAGKVLLVFASGPVTYLAFKMTRRRQIMP